MSDRGGEHPRVEYVREFTKLSVWYAHRRIRLGLSTFEDAVNTRVDLFRMTRYAIDHGHPSRGDTIPEWDALLVPLRQAFDRHSDAASTDDLERETLDILWPHFRLPDACAPVYPDPPSDRPYESWTCNYSDEGRIHLHIANVYRPHSPLAEKRSAFAACLLRLLKDSLGLRPDVRTASCGSWLNSVPTFLDLFPEDWHHNAVPSPEVRFTMGHWGQFTDRRGGFHARNGQAFRHTGDFPYPALRCHCRIDALIHHLESRSTPW